MKQRTLDGVQAVLGDTDEVLLEQSETQPRDKFLWVVDEYLNQEQVKRLVSHLDFWLLVSHLDFWLLTGKLFREEPQKPTIDPSLADAEV